MVPLLIALLLASSAAAIARRHEMRIPLTVQIRLMDISENDVPFDKLKEFLDAVLPVFDLPRADKGIKIDAKIEFKYNISSSTAGEFKAFDNFIRQEGLLEGETYQIQVAKLDQFLIGLDDAQSSFQRFTVLIVRSRSLPKHLIYDDNPSRCIQSHVSSVAFMDLSAQACGFEITREVQSQVQFHTPIYHHPWPGTFASDQTTRWSPTPATEVVNHRISRLGGVIASAARTYGSTNYANILASTNRPFFIPIICFQNGDAMEYIHFSIDRFRKILDEILPIGHQGYVLAVSYGVEELPRAAIAVARSKSYNHSFTITKYGAELSTEYAYFDSELLWEYLKDTVNELVEDMKHTLQFSLYGGKFPAQADNLVSYPIVVLSDFHHAKSVADSHRLVQPLFENDRAVKSSAGGEVTFALHSSANNTSRIVKSIGGWDWMDIDLTNPDKLVAEVVSRIICGLTTPEMQQYDSFKVIDVTWSSLSARPFSSGGIDAGHLNSLSMWSAKRGIALFRLNEVLVKSNDFIDEVSLTLDRLKSLEEKLVEKNSNLGDIIGVDLRNFVFPGLGNGSVIFPRFVEMSIPPEFQRSVENINDGVANIIAIIENMHKIIASPSFISLESFLSKLAGYEKNLKVTEATVQVELQNLLRHLRSCTVTYEPSASTSRLSLVSNDDENALIWYFAGGSLLLLATFSVAGFWFVKYVEAKAKKLA